MYIPIWIIAAGSILCLLAWMFIGFIVCMETNDRILNDDFFLPVVLIWPIAVPVFFIMTKWHERRDEESRLNAAAGSYVENAGRAAMGQRHVGYRPRTVAPEDGPPTKKPTPIKD